MLLGSIADLTLTNEDKMSIINEKTFEASTQKPEEWMEEGTIVGTVEVTLRNETRRVPATKSKAGQIVASGMVGRYQTGTKTWPAHVEQYTWPKTGKIVTQIHFGRDDRAGRFNKMNCLFFA